MKFTLIVFALTIACIVAEDKYKYEDKYPGKYEDKYTDKYEDKYPGKYEDKYTGKYEDDKYEDKYPGKYEDKYTDKYDSMDLDEVLNNKRLLNAYTNCVLEKGKCTPEGKELKSHISEALQNGCKKCTGKQRQGMRRVIKHYMKYEQDSWKQMVDKYDPERVYSTKYEKEMKSL